MTQYITGAFNRVYNMGASALNTVGSYGSGAINWVKNGSLLDNRAVHAVSGAFQGLYNSLLAPIGNTVYNFVVTNPGTTALIGVVSLVAYKAFGTTPVQTVPATEFSTLKNKVEGLEATVKTMSENITLYHGILGEVIKFDDNTTLAQHVAAKQLERAQEQQRADAQKLAEKKAQEEAAKLAKNENV